MQTGHEAAPTAKPSFWLVGGLLGGWAFVDGVWLSYVSPLRRVEGGRLDDWMVKEGDWTIGWWRGMTGRLGDWMVNEQKQRDFFPLRCGSTILRYPILGPRLGHKLKHAKKVTTTLNLRISTTGVEHTLKRENAELKPRLRG